MSMLAKLEAFCLAALLIGFPLDGWAGPIKVSISSTESTFKSGQPIPLNIAIFNASNQPQWLTVYRGNDHAEITFVIKVTTKTGVPVKLTDWGRSIYVDHDPDTWPSAYVAAVVPAGEHFDDRSFLNKVYDIKIPGEYIVSVTKDYNVAANKDRMISNELRITVTH